MEIEPGRKYAVLTGDCIGFSGLPVEIRQRMYFVLKACENDLQIAFPHKTPCGLDVFRGDGWQTLISDPALSLRIGLFIRAYVRAHLWKKNTSMSPKDQPAKAGCGVDTRFAIGVGPVDYVPENRVAAGDGPAFRRSGKLLDQMASSGADTMGFATEGIRDEGMGGILDGIVRLAGDLAGQWTQEQALIVIGALQGWTHSMIANLWMEGADPGMVEARLQQARWNTVGHGMALFESALKEGVF